MPLRPQRRRPLLLAILGRSHEQSLFLQVRIIGNADRALLLVFVPFFSAS